MNNFRKASVTARGRVCSGMKGPPAGSSAFALTLLKSYYTSVLKGAELHKETTAKFLVLSKAEIFSLLNFPPMRSVHQKQDVAQRAINM